MSLSKENKVIIDGQTRYGGLNQPNLKFFKVNVDCWERVFDFMALCDIIAMSQTCQRMQQIAGYYFRKNFHGTPFYLNELYRKWILVHGKSLERDDFLHFADTIDVRMKLERFRTLSSAGMLLC